MSLIQEGADPESLLALAKAGYGPALGRLLDRYRDHLTLVARLRVGRRLQTKLDVDDLLQEVSLEVHREIGRFRGDTEREFQAWLRQILASILSNQVRHYFGTLRRDPRRERRFAPELDGSSRAADGGLIAPHSTPSERASRSERDVLLADALGMLPAAYREVIVLRQLEGLSFPEIADRMGRTEDSVKNLWIRALARLRRALGDMQ